AHSDCFLVSTEDGLQKVGMRGVLRRRQDRVVVGDFVEFENGTISRVLERKNYFRRPSVANIDIVVIVVSPEPKPDFLLIDKLVLNALYSGIEIVFAVNKSDVSDTLFYKIKEEYSFVKADFYKVGALNKDGVDEFSKRLTGKLSLFAGQSAVGKTSLVNALFGTVLKTGGLSERVMRGKHTTTYSEIHCYFNTRIIDTPGFAVIDGIMKSNELKDYYPEYVPLAKDCKFLDCKHLNEPDCAVKKAIEEGKLSKDRYQRYLEIYEELRQKEKRYEKN
ncbi:MAG: ribosome small subunit-dependent GTPase A, partial [Clostridiales bacterium]|nr:ribosome small subunit-dependent GTPase A [Clostridiales bacterium]